MDSRFEEDNLNKKEKKKFRKEISRTVILGLALANITTLFGGCNTKAAKPEDLQPSPEDTVATTQSMDIQAIESVNYLTEDVTNVLKTAARLDITNVYDGLAVTGRKLGDINIYKIKKTGDYVIISGNERIKLDLDKKGDLKLASGTLNYELEGYAIPITVRIGKDKISFNKSKEKWKEEKVKVDKPTLTWEGIDFKDKKSDKTMLRYMNGEIYINLNRFATFINFDVVDTGTADTVEIDTADQNTNFDTLELVGYDDNIRYCFIENTNKVIISTKTKNNITEQKYINVDGATMNVDDTLWMPIDWLTPVFGVKVKQGETLTNIWTLKSGFVLPKTIVLDTTVKKVVDKNSKDNTQEADPDRILENIDKNTQGEIGLETQDPDKAINDANVSDTSNTIKDNYHANDKSKDNTSNKSDKNNVSKSDDKKDDKYDKKSDDKKSDNNTDKKQDNKKTEDTKSDDKKSDDKKSEDKKTEDKKTDDKKQDNTTETVKDGKIHKDSNGYWIPNNGDPQVRWSGTNNETRGTVGKMSWNENADAVKVNGIVINGMPTHNDYPGEIEDIAYDVNNVLKKYNFPDAGTTSSEDCARWIINNYEILKSHKRDMAIAVALESLQTKRAGNPIGKENLVALGWNGEIAEFLNTMYGTYEFGGTHNEY